jgi:hypothetical protein
MTVALDSTSTAAAATRTAARRGAVRTVLNTMEWVLFRGDSLTVARANAWAAVQEDRARARARAEAFTAFEVESA